MYVSVGKGAGAQGQSESRSDERLLQCSARTATRERTETYVSIHDKGADKGLRQFLTLVENVAIWMKCKESACGMDRSVLGRT